MMNPWLILGAVGAVMAAYGGGYLQGNNAGKAKIQQAWDREKAEQLADFARRQQEARDKEIALQNKADQIRKEKDREVRDLHARNTALSNIVRDREARPAAGGMPENPGAGSSSCTGKELYREDGEFLVGFARDADEIRLALKQCYKQYNSLTEQVAQ